MRLFVVILVGVVVVVVLRCGCGHCVVGVVVVFVGAVFVVGSVGGLFLACCIRLLFVVLKFHCGNDTFVPVLGTALRIGVRRGVRRSLIEDGTRGVGIRVLIDFRSLRLEGGPLLIGERLLGSLLWIWWPLRLVPS